MCRNRTALKRAQAAEQSHPQSSPCPGLHGFGFRVSGMGQKVGLESEEMGSRDASLGYVGLQALNPKP